MATNTEQLINEFFLTFPKRKYSKGHILLHNGDVIQTIYYLVNGQIKMYDITPRGDELILNVFKPFAFLPMSSVINNRTNDYIYEAETAIEVYEAPAATVLDFLQSRPEVTFDLLKRVYRGMDGLLGRVSHLMASSARKRLLYELVLESRRFGKEESDGTYILSMNETALGARAGLSRETVSRELHKLKQERLVSVQPKRITLLNLTALKQMLEQEA